MKRSRLVAFTSSVLVPIISFALFTLADGPASRAQGQVATAQLPSSPGTSPTISTAAVLRFGVEGSENHDISSLSAKSCPVVVAPTDGQASTDAQAVQVDPAILDAISQKMNERLSKKMAVLVDPAESSIPVGAMVISGCITRANAGNAKARLVGMGVGASMLSVHVIALRKTEDGFHPFDDFALQVKGGDMLPPLGPAGLAVHAVRDRKQSLAADAGKIADKILKKISSDQKAKQKSAVT
jgi:Domain of unknown function (DUF4410)